MNPAEIIANKFQSAEGDHRQQIFFSFLMFPPREEGHKPKSLHSLQRQLADDQQ